MAPSARRQGGAASRHSRSDEADPVAPRTAARGIRVRRPSSACADPSRATTTSDVRIARSAPSSPSRKSRYAAWSSCVKASSGLPAHSSHPGDREGLRQGRRRQHDAAVARPPRSLPRPRRGPQHRVPAHEGQGKRHDQRQSSDGQRRRGRATDGAYGPPLPSAPRRCSGSRRQRARTGATRRCGPRSRWRGPVRGRRRTPRDAVAPGGARRSAPGRPRPHHHVERHVEPGSGPQPLATLRRHVVEHLERSTPASTTAARWRRGPAGSPPLLRRSPTVGYGGARGGGRPRARRRRAGQLRAGSPRRRPGARPTRCVDPAGGTGSRPERRRSANGTREKVCARTTPNVARASQAEQHDRDSDIFVAAAAQAGRVREHDQGQCQHNHVGDDRGASPEVVQHRRSQFGEDRDVVPAAPCRPPRTAPRRELTRSRGCGRRGPPASPNRHRCGRTRPRRPWSTPPPGWSSATEPDQSAVTPTTHDRRSCQDARPTPTPGPPALPRG